jgi:uncharacterized membrane protein
MRPGGLHWQGRTALILGAILLACGVLLFVSANWDQLGPATRYFLVLAMVAIFHLGGGVALPHFRSLSAALHAAGTFYAGAAIALVGQIFNIQQHWPAIVMLWALAALAGWALLRDEAQETLALLLIPAWIFSEISFHAGGHIGDSIYMGRALFTWAVLYLTFFLGSRQKTVRGILLACAVIAAVAGIVLMLSGWVSWSAEQTFVPFSTRVWAWTAIAALPLAIAAFHGHKGLVPPVAAVAFSVVLPWCNRTWTESYTGSGGITNVVTRTAPNLAAHALVAAFAFFLCAWGVRLSSQTLVNLSITGFAAAVGWFYFSHIFSKLGRSLGMIVLGILFLAGGWVLEKTRRRILARMKNVEMLTGKPTGGTP